MTAYDYECKELFDLKDYFYVSVGGLSDAKADEVDEAILTRLGRMSFDRVLNLHKWLAAYRNEELDLEYRHEIYDTLHKPRGETESQNSWLLRAGDDYKTVIQRGRNVATRLGMPEQFELSLAVNLKKYMTEV